MQIIPVSVEFSIFDESKIVSDFKDVIQKVNDQQSTALLSGQLYQDLLTAFTEAVANVVRHAKELQHHKEIKCFFDLSPEKIKIIVEDRGHGFDLSKISTPRFDNMVDSGRGIFMMRQLMDEIYYEKKSGKNQLLLIRNLMGPNSSDVDLLYEISNVILQGTDVQSVYKIILDKAVEVFKVEKASIMIFDSRLKKLKVVASCGMKKNIKEKIMLKPGESIAGYVFQHAKPCLIEDIKDNQSGWESRQTYKSSSFISAPMMGSPLKMSEKAIGVINMTDKIDGKPFTKKDLKLLTTIANQAATYLHICHLLNQAKDVHLLKREIEIAREMQQSYLKFDAPKIKNIDFSGWCQTAQSVGGDYYDFISRDSSHVYVVIADVSGHNVAAAITMMNFRSLLKSILLHEKKPGSILKKLNENLFDDLKKHNQFISCVLAQINLKTRKMQIANAGHHSPLLINTKSIQTLINYRDSSLVLGAFENEIYKTQTFNLKKNSRLLFYTDGYVEAVNEKNERLGNASFIKILKKNSHLNAEKLAEKLYKFINNYRKKASLKDDITVGVVGL